MKLGVSINVYEGAELLQPLVDNIRLNVDFILINWQEYSYTGNRISDNDKEKILNLKGIDQFNIFRIQKYATNISDAKELEKRKRNEGRSICLKNGCDYFQDLDVDEFYKKEEYKEAKEFIQEKSIQFSYCNFINYHNKPIYKSKRSSNGIVPFISSLKMEGGLGSDVITFHTDPTRGNNFTPMQNMGAIVHMFGTDKLLMHHYTNCRLDLCRKYNDTTLACLDRGKTNELIEIIRKIDDSHLKIEHQFPMLDKEFEIVPNYFNIEI